MFCEIIQRCRSCPPHSQSTSLGARKVVPMVVSIILKATKKPCKAIMLLKHILQKYYFNGSLLFFEWAYLFPHNVSETCNKWHWCLFHLFSSHSAVHRCGHIPNFMKIRQLAPWGQTHEYDHTKKCLHKIKESGPGIK